MITIKELIESGEIEADVNDPQIFLHLNDAIPFRIGTELKTPTMIAKITNIEWVSTHNTFRVRTDNGQSIGITQLIKAINNNQIILK